MQTDTLDLDLLATLKPEKILSVSEWADRHRILSQKASSEPGKYRTARTPYMKDIMEALSSNSPIREVVFMKAAQVGATEAGNNWLGYVMDHSPAPMLIVMPTVDLAKKNSRQRVDPLIEDSPRLRGLVVERRSREAGNTVLSKDFPGGVLVMTGANSASGLRSMPAKYVFLDEVDAYPIDVEGEGNPIDLAKARQRTFYKRKTFHVSTPTIAGQSLIEALYDGSDQRYYMVPCARCDFFQKLEFKGLIWPENEPKKAVYRCISCEKTMENWEKTTILARGYWEKTAISDVAGFHLNALYSPVGWYSWGEIAEDFLKAKKTPEKLRTFINTVLGETWKDKSERPDWQRLYERREKYEIGKVPDGVLFLTCGVDVQKDRIEAEVIGWGRDKVSWSIDYRVFLGDTSEPVVWTELEKLMSELFPRASAPDILLPIKMTCVDSGYNTQVVYSWCRRFNPMRVAAVKGRENYGAMFSRPNKVDVTQAGKTLRRGLRVWSIGTSIVKNEFYGWLRQAKSLDGETDPPGFCHFPEYGEDFFKQLTAEEMVTKVVKGYKHTEWQKTRERNEALDCRVYGRVAAGILGLDRFNEDRWRALEKESGVFYLKEQESLPIPSEQVVPQQTPVQKPVATPPQRRRSNWL